MTLFLTSSPCDDRVPGGCDLPCIFFERNGFVRELQRWVQPGGSFLVIAAFPDAHAHNDEMASTFAGCFRWHGMGFDRVEVLDSRNAADAPDMVRRSSVILLAGGHVPTENRWFHQLGLRELLADYPGVIMGVSAGSMNAARRVYAQPEEPGEATDPAYERFLEGLALTEMNVLPHYQMVKDNLIDGLRLYEDVTFGDSMGECFIVLVDGSYVLEAEGRTEIRGEAWAIRDGVMNRICSDGECVAWQI